MINFTYRQHPPRTHTETRFYNDDVLLFRLNELSLFSVYFQRFTSGLIPGPVSVHRLPWAQRIVSVASCFVTLAEHGWTDFKFSGRWREFADGCLTSIQMGLFQQVLYLFTLFQGSVCMVAQGEKTPTSLLLKKSELYIWWRIFRITCNIISLGPGGMMHMH